MLVYSTIRISWRLHTPIINDFKTIRLSTVQPFWVVYNKLITYSELVFQTKVMRSLKVVGLLIIILTTPRESWRNDSSYAGVQSDAQSARVPWYDVQGSYRDVKCNFLNLVTVLNILNTFKSYKIYIYRFHLVRFHRNITADNVKHQATQCIPSGV